MLSVLHLNASSGGGAFVVAQRLSEALNATGEVKSEHLVFTGKPGNYHLWSNNWYRKKVSFGLHALEKLDFLRYEKDASVRFAFSHGLTGIDIEKNLLVKDADIIHLHWINKGFISLNGLTRLLKMGKPVVWTCHDMWPFTGGCYYSGTCTNYLRGCGDCKMLRNPSKNDLSFQIFGSKMQIFKEVQNLSFISPSHWLKDIGHSSGTAVGKSIEVIPNGIDTSIFCPKPETKKQFEKNRNSKFTILFAAANIADKRKGYSDFLDYCNSLIQHGFTNFRVVYIGQNKMDKELDSIFEHSYTGYIGDPNKMADWYRNADLYVTTSNDDNLPTTIMESLASGTPVAAFAVGGIPEMVTDGKTGVLSTVYDSENLALKTIALLHGEHGHGAEISDNCRGFAVQHYDRDLIVQKHLKLYRDMSHVI